MGQLWVKDDKKPARTPTDLQQRMQKKVNHAHYEMERARHDSEEWKHVAEKLAHEKIELFKFNRRLRRNRMYERIGWLLLSISLALAHHL